MKVLLPLSPVPEEEEDKKGQEVSRDRKTGQKWICHIADSVKSSLPTLAQS